MSQTTTTSAPRRRAAAPSIDDARRAARALVDEAAAAEVLLYGSVARDEQHEHSDIDLVVIFDDLDDAITNDDTADYFDDPSGITDLDTRLAKRLQLEALASTASGFRCSVRLTDWPRWKHRTQVVTHSFEAGINEYATSLAVSPDVRCIDWSKMTDRQDDNRYVVWESMESAFDAIAGGESHLAPTSTEVLHKRAGRLASQQREIAQRARQVSKQMAMAIENCVKTLWRHQPPPGMSVLPPRHHRIHDLVKSLAPDAKTMLERLFALHYYPPEHVGGWREYADYPAEIDPPDEMDVFDELGIESRGHHRLERSAVTQADRIRGLACDIVSETAAYFERHLDHIAKFHISRDAFNRRAVVVRDLKACSFGRLYETVDRKRRKAQSKRDRKQASARQRQERRERRQSRRADRQARRTNAASTDDSPSDAVGACGKRMPRARALCVLPRGHSGACRSMK